MSQADNLSLNFTIYESIGPMWCFGKWYIPQDCRHFPLPWEGPVEYIGAFPIRQDLPVIPHPDPSKIGWYGTENEDGSITFTREKPK